MITDQPPSTNYTTGRFFTANSDNYAHINLDKAFFIWQPAALKSGM